MTQPPAAPSGGGITLSRNALLAIVGVIVLVVATVVVVLVAQADEASAQEIELEGTSTFGGNPFMEPVGEDEADVEPPEGSGGEFDGDTPGLYGGTRNIASCDPEQMVVFLEQNADKAAAWAGVLGISVADIDSYVAELTPLILRSDTAVTNHGFENGEATEIPAILQAGTAVLVDQYGVPAVKCYCGNPLTKPKTYSDPTYRGTQWPGFTPSGITIIQETTVIINIFTVADPHTGEAFTRPRGGTGATDGDAEGTPPPTSTTTAAPSTTTAPPAATGDDAIAIVRQRLEVDCAGVTYPFEPATAPLQFSAQLVEGSLYDVTVVSPNAVGSDTFVWRVDVAAGTITPQNALAQQAVTSCGALSG